jgi:hypothetical protein
VKVKIATNRQFRRISTFCPNLPLAERQKLGIFGKGQLYSLQEKIKLMENSFKLNYISVKYIKIASTLVRLGSYIFDFPVFWKILGTQGTTWTR